MKTSETETWRGRYTVELKELLRIGSDDLADDPYVFTSINDFHVDAAGNVYTLDYKESRIKVFSPTGKYIREFELKKGQGPGEFQRALHFAIGPNGDFYIIDINARRITRMDQTGKILDMMTLRSHPGIIAVGGDGGIFMTAGILNDLDEFHVYKYHYPDGKLLAAFCPSTELSRWTGRVGLEGAICAGSEGNIYYSFGIPYDVREYAPDGRLLNRFARKIPGWHPPRIDRTGLPDTPVITLTMAVMPDGKLLHSFFDKRTNPYARCFDIFDKNGDWLIGFAVDRGNPDAFGRLVRVDGRGHIYMEFWRPYPHIRKYGITFVPVT